MDSEKVVNEIVKVFWKLDEYHGKYRERRPQNRREWTHLVRRTLSRLGKDKGYDVRPRTGYGCGEWLWDVCWQQRDKSSLVEVPLVAECEWENGHNLVEVRKDFEKLLAARTSMRVMLYDARQNGKHTAESIAEELCNCVGKFNGKPGDVHLLIAAEGNEAPWKYFRITDQGKTRPPKLEQVSEQAKKNVIWKDRAE